jgi:hypothetical protein
MNRRDSAAPARALSIAVRTVYCPGGHSFSDGEIPSPVLFHLIPDADIESLVSGGGDGSRRR